MHVLSAVAPKNSVSSLYQHPAALRGARLAVRGGVAETARRTDLDVSVAERLFHGEREGRFRRSGRRSDRKKLFEAPNVGHDVTTRQQVIIGARGASQKRACAR